MHALPPDLTRGLSLDFNGTAAMGMCSTWRLGYPLRGADDSSLQGSLRVLYPHFVGFGAQLSSQMRGISSPLAAAWDVCLPHHPGLKTCAWLKWYGRMVLVNDLRWVGVSLLLVLMCIVGHTHSILLGLLGTAEIALSIPLALWVYRIVFGIRLFGALHIIGLFLLLGIGCDDLFVMYDAWQQAQWLAHESALSTTSGRLWWAYRRAAKAMLVSTLTDVGAFASSTLCIVPNLVSFAVFTSLLAIANYVLVCTMWPCALVLHHRYCQLGNAQSGARRRWLHLGAARSRVALPRVDGRITSGADSPPRSPAKRDGIIVDATPDVTSTQATQDAPRTKPKPRLLERWFAECYAPWLSNTKHALALVVALGGVAAVLGPHAVDIGGPRHYLILWSKHSDAYRYLEMRSEYFYDMKYKLRLLWGTRGVDRTGARCFFAEPRAFSMTLPCSLRTGRATLHRD
jgi:hypothetical protein